MAAFFIALVADPTYMTKRKKRNLMWVCVIQICNRSISGSATRAQANEVPKDPKYRRSQLCLGQLGFTLIELIMVLVLLGVLSVFAAPKFFNRSDFDSRGFHDVTLSYLRYAQKTAVAQRRTVCASFTTTSVALQIAKNAAAFDCAGVNGVALNGPDGKASATVTTMNYGATAPTAFGFDGLGQPVNSSGALLATQTLSVVGSGRTITVESGTGYVHE